MELTVYTNRGALSYYLQDATIEGRSRPFEGLKDAQDFGPERVERIKQLTFEGTGLYTAAGAPLPNINIGSSAGTQLNVQVY